MPNSPHEELAAIRENLLDGMKSYLEASGDGCGYKQPDIDRCAVIVDAYCDEIAKKGMSQDALRDTVKKTVLQLNALNETCDNELIETDQREALCQLLLTAAQAAGLDTDEDITEEWREW